MRSTTPCLFLLVTLLSAAAYAKAPGKPPASKHNRHAPIEVTSDTLEVFQNENRAVFSGHVVAIQDEIRLKSDVMTVYYRHKPNTDESKTAAKGDKSVTPATPDDSSIQKIDAKGNVFLSTPQETASGDTGTYEPDDHLIHLNDHVVLTKGKNVLKGDHLVYNMQTEQSKLTSDGQPVKADNGQPDKKGRIHALFVPGGDNKLKSGTASSAGKDNAIKDNQPKSESQP